MIFLDAINRILRSSAIIRGDTDPIATFNDIAHNASLNVGIIAVQQSIDAADCRPPNTEGTQRSGVITLATNTRVYDLASGFTRFFGTPHFYNVAQNQQIYEYAGGLEQLQIEIFNFATQYGAPNWWYWEPGNTTLKQVGFFLVPSAAEDTQQWTYDYESTVMVTASSDAMPFHNDEENIVFVEMAARRFKFMFEDTKNVADIQNILDKDTSYRSARATLFKLLKGQNSSERYGYSYY